MALLAEGILKLHWDQSIPVNLARIVKSMGVQLHLQAGLPCSARLCIDHSNQAHLMLAQQLPNIYQRYVVAHALGHVALHHMRPGMQRDLHIGNDFRVDFSLPHNLDANDFALRLLLPESAMRYAVAQMHARTVQELEHVFAAPALFIKQRLTDLGLHLPRSTTAQRMPRNAPQTTDVEAF